MLFAIGFIAGLVTALLIIFFIHLFRTPIESVMNQADIQMKQIEANVGLAPKGFVYIPPDDAEIARQEIIAENNKAGKDTKVSDLM